MTTQTIEGSVFALARWYQTPKYANKPEDDFVREEILAEVYNATEAGFLGDAILVKTPSGACLIESRHVEGAPLRLFSYVEDKRWTRTDFWMNESSVSDLRDHLARVPRGDFTKMFVEAVG